MITQTVLKTVAIGIVASDIKEDESYIDVFPIEIQPGRDGELTSSEDFSNKITNMSGQVDIVMATKTDLIKAKWLPDGDTNRLEPPTVCKNEWVRLIRYSDHDQYYWTTIYNQLELRKLEKRTVVVSNKRSIDVAPEELLKHSYHSQMDTINKLVHLHTSDTDGEYTAYDIAIDTKEGQLEIIDGKGNRIFLDSQDDKLVVEINKIIETKTKDHTNNNDKLVNNSDTSITNNTMTKTDNAETEYVINTGTKTETIQGAHTINLQTLAISNGSDELVSLISELAQALADAKGIGNLMLPVPMDGDTIAAALDIKARVDGFKP